MVNLVGFVKPKFYAVIKAHSLDGIAEMKDYKNKEPEIKLNNDIEAVFVGESLFDWILIALVILAIAYIFGGDLWQ